MDRPRFAPMPDWATPEGLAAVPELSSLAILEATLAIAETHVLIANPQLADPLAPCDPCDRFVHDLLRDLACATASIHEYVRCSLALMQAMEQRDIPF